MKNVQNRRSINSSISLYLYIHIYLSIVTCVCLMACILPIRVMSILDVLTVGISSNAGNQDDIDGVETHKPYK